MKRVVIASRSDLSDLIQNGYLSYFCHEAGKPYYSFRRLVSIELGDSPDELVFTFKDTSKQEAEKFIRRWSGFAGKPNLISEIETRQVGDYHNDWVEGSAHFELSPRQKRMFDLAVTYPDGLFNSLDVDVNYDSMRIICHIDIDWKPNKAYSGDLVSASFNKFSGWVKIKEGRRIIHKHDIYGSCSFTLENCGNWWMGFYPKNEEDKLEHGSAFSAGESRHGYITTFNSVEEIKEEILKSLEHALKVKLKYGRYNL